MSQPISTYRVLLQKEQLVFSAAHFITFAGDICECLHGHNYAVKAEVAGPLDENQYVVDFIAFRDTLAEIVKSLDHHVLLPTQHPLIEVCAEDAGSCRQVWRQTLDIPQGGLHAPADCQHNG